MEIRIMLVFRCYVLQFKVGFIKRKLAVSNNMNWTVLHNVMQYSVTKMLPYRKKL